MLEDMLHYVCANNLPPVYILVDEYDNFTNQLFTAYKDPLYEEVTTADSFLRTFFKVIKAGIGEGSVRTCFCTGVLPDAEPLFNSTILTYFLKKFATNNGDIPEEMIDENLRTDINWIRRLTLSLDNAKEVLDALVMDDGLTYGLPSLRSKFNKQKFFDKNFYPISLFYLGMVTLKDRFNVVLPNLTMRSIYIDYYNQLNNINPDDTRYAPTYEQYLGQFPAQVFDKMNENFVRCSFYELCSRYLSWAYTFALEQNNPAGRSDFEMTGIPGTEYYKDDRVPTTYALTWCIS